MCPDKENIGFSVRVREFVNPKEVFFNVTKFIRPLTTVHTVTEGERIYWSIWRHLKLVHLPAGQGELEFWLEWAGSFKLFKYRPDTLWQMERNAIVSNEYVSV